MADQQMPAAQRGLDDAAAERLESLAREFRPALRRYFGRRARQRADVDDLVQDVLVRLAVRGDCGSIDQPEAYLMRTATNVWRDHLRKKETHAEEGHEEYTEGRLFEDHGPDDEVVGIQSVAAVLTALDQLPDRTRQVFVLCRVEGIRQKNVAKRLGVSVSAVEKHMIRAIAHLASRLGE
ncbi:MAG: sigma-70 family RNA polymerase sigma factor [Pseudomonadales bacterium]|nr:sigma-70 family RNA polymerase sigma factor [Pseudomonadales bacterium]